MNNVFMMIAASMLVLSGCAGAPKGRFDVDVRRVTIITDPEGATVTQINPFYQPPTVLGQTPITDRSVMIVSKITKMKHLPFHEAKMLMEQVDNVIIRIEKDGYETYDGTLRTDPASTVVHTIQLHPKGSDSK